MWHVEKPHLWPLGLLVSDSFLLDDHKDSGLLFSEYRDVPWLINRYALSVVPSATSLILLRGVESVSARLLTIGIFQQTANSPDINRAEALRRSMVRLIIQNDSDDLFSYAHPIFWALFTVVGDGA